MPARTVCILWESLKVDGGGFFGSISVFMDMACGCHFRAYVGAGCEYYRATTENIRNVSNISFWPLMIFQLRLAIYLVQLEFNDSCS